MDIDANIPNLFLVWRETDSRLARDGLPSGARPTSNWRQSDLRLAPD